MLPAKIELLTNDIELSNAEKAVIFLHGRGGTAEDIMSLNKWLPLNGYYCVAPRAEQQTWYPYTFMADISDNEPHLSNSLDTISVIVDHLQKSGINREHIYIVGFSQGACLALEFAARNAARYGGIIAFTGGLIGAKIDMSRYQIAFDNTPIFVGTGNPDAHVPLERVRESAKLLERLGADVKLEVYEYMGHTVSSEECKAAADHIFNK